MDQMYALLKAVSIFFLLVLFMQILKRQDIFNDSHQPIFNRLVTDLVLPVTIFSTMAGSSVRPDEMVAAMVMLASIVCCGYLAYRACRIMALSRSMTGSLVLLAGIGCTSTLAYPLIRQIFGGVSELLGPSHELAGLAKILVFFLLSVLIGFVGSYLMHRCTGFLLRNAGRSANRGIIRLNWCAAALMAFSNGANDSQKQLGIIALALFAAGLSVTADVPVWARIACAALLALGTLGGGWRIMNTLGRKIFRIEPVHSFDSQVFSASSIALSTLAGAPVSSTQVITMSVLGVGAAENPRKVKWEVGKNILVAMLVTIPVTMTLAAGMYFALSHLTGV